MKILEHRALRGPNYFSRFPTIYMLLDIGELEDRPSDKADGFVERLVAAIPTLKEHRCSPGYPGGFIERVERGTWAGHIVEHVALDLQCLAGMVVGFGKTRETQKRGVYSVVYRYRDEDAGLQAGRDAVAIVSALFEGRSVDVSAMVHHLKEMREEHAYGPSTASIVNEANNRGIPSIRLNKGSFIQLGHGMHQKRIRATMTGATSGIGVEIADDKRWTKEILRDAGVPVPRGSVCRTWEGAQEIAQQIGYPVVVKPLVGNHGKGITVDVRNEEELRAAYDAALNRHPKVLIEQFLVGSDHRLLVIDGKLVAAARRDEAHVVGDGVRTLQALIDATNADPRRGFGHEKMLTRIHIDPMTERLLKKQGLTLDAVPAAGLRVILKSTANLSTGGTATDVTDELHPAIQLMAERVAKIIGLDIMGIDVVATDLRHPLNEVRGGIVEVNAAPGFRMHLEPTVGEPRNVAAHVIDMLFPNGSTGKIPVVAVTGTNGKTTTVRLIDHILKYNGARVGIACTGSVEVNNHVIAEGDYSGPAGAGFVLREPTIDHAVLEVARGGILRRGLGFDECDVGVLLNVGRDHLGQGGIETLEDLARLKGAVIDAVGPESTAVLNADDPQVLALRENVRGKTILFSMDPANAELLAHVDAGGVVVTVNGGAIVLRRGGAEYRVAETADVPITLGGHATFNVQNAMAAVAAGYALGLTEETVRAGLHTFNSTTGQNPGRMNLIDVGPYKVLIDYGHNVPALQALAPVLPHLARGRRIAVSCGVGNRLDEDLKAVGRQLASMYEHVFLSDPDPRGRARGATPEVMRQGLIEGGLPATNVHMFLEEDDAVDAALAMAKEGDLVVLQVDHIKRGIVKAKALRAAFAERVAEDEAAAQVAAPRPSED